jgi:hypothetical protein
MVIDTELKLSETESKFLNSLIADSVIYNLSVAEALEYIKTRFKKISEPCYPISLAYLQSSVNNTQHKWILSIL